MIYLLAAGLIALLFAIGAALIYRSHAKMLQVYAKQQEQRAEAVEAINTNRQQLDTALETIHETHREETIHDNDPAHLALRADFDNNWSDNATGLHDGQSAADHSNSAALADSPGATGHRSRRTDLRE